MGWSGKTRQRGEGGMSSSEAKSIFYYFVFYLFLKIK
jgi:hypothetical protein